MSKPNKSFSGGKRNRRAGPSTSDQLVVDRTLGHRPIKGKIVPRVEMHYNDIAATAYACDTTGTVTALNLIAEGNDNVNRLGRKAFMHDVSVRGQVTIASTGVPQQARVMLVWDNAANGALPLITDVLTGISAQSFINPNNVARFTVISDQIVNLGAYNVAATTSLAFDVIKSIRETYRLAAPTEYSGTTAAIASVQNGTILLLTMGSIAAGATAATATLSTRVTFTDLL